MAIGTHQHNAGHAFHNPKANTHMSATTKNKSSMVTFRCEDELKASLEEIAKGEMFDVTLSKLIVHVLRQYVQSKATPAPAEKPKAPAKSKAKTKA